MKSSSRNTPVGAIRSLLTVFFLGGCVLISLLSLSADAAQIVSVTGKVQVRSSGEDSWKDAHIDMPLAFGDRIRTASSSSVDILLDENTGNLIHITEKTLVVLSSVVPKHITKLDLSYGKIYAQVETVFAETGFEVSTPSLIAGVRGTAWSVVSQAAQDEIAVFERQVRVRAFDKNNESLGYVDIDAGFKNVTKRFQQPGEVFPVGATEMQQWSVVKERFDSFVSGTGPESTDVQSLIDPAGGVNCRIPKTMQVKDGSGDAHSGDDTVQSEEVVSGEHPRVIKSIVVK